MYFNPWKSMWKILDEKWICFSALNALPTCYFGLYALYFLNIIYYTLKPQKSKLLLFLIIFLFLFFFFPFPSAWNSFSPFPNCVPLLLLLPFYLFCFYSIEEEVEAWEFGYFLLNFHFSSFLT